MKDWSALMQTAKFCTGKKKNKVMEKEYVPCLYPETVDIVNSRGHEQQLAV